METRCDVCGGGIRYGSRRYTDGEDIDILEGVLLGVPERHALAVEVDSPEMRQRDIPKITICKICLDQMKYELDLSGNI